MVLIQKKSRKLMGCILYLSSDESTMRSYRYMRAFLQTGKVTRPALKGGVKLFDRRPHPRSG